MNNHQNQKFTFLRYNPETKTWEQKGYLLMPNEVTEFICLQSKDYGLSFEYAFERITGKLFSDLKDVKLVIEYTEVETYPRIIENAVPK
jgi:hypothetical protein